MNGLGLANFTVRCSEWLKERIALLDLITLTQRRPLPPIITLHPTKEQDTFVIEQDLHPSADNSPILMDENNISYGCSKFDGKFTYLYKLHDQPDTPIMDIYDEFMLSKGMIANFNESKPIATSFGLFILNYLIYAQPFGNIIPYNNGTFNYKRLNSQVAHGVLHGTITKEMYDKFMNNVYFIGCFTELSVPCMTVKSMSTSKEIIKRRDELFAKYKDQLDDPIISAKIEDELIAMDRAYLSDDDASGWIITSKEYDVARKKMFITIGVTEAFSNDSNEFTFIPNSLSDKMNLEYLPAIANDIRRGSYMRGMETAKGGEETKFVLRIFQNVSITEDDCHTKEGMDITLHMGDLSDYEGRYVLMPDGSTVELTPENFGQFVDKPIKLRSVKHCKAKDGFCYKCCSRFYENLGYRSIGMRVVEATSTLMYTAMKAMHVSKVVTVNIDNLDDFVV